MSACQLVPSEAVQSEEIGPLRKILCWFNDLAQTKKFLALIKVRTLCVQGVN